MIEKATVTSDGYQGISKGEEVDITSWEYHPKCKKPAIRVRGWNVADVRIEPRDWEPVNIFMDPVKRPRRNVMGRILNRCEHCPLFSVQSGGWALICGHPKFLKNRPIDDGKLFRWFVASNKELEDDTLPKWCPFPEEGKENGER